MLKNFLTIAIRSFLRQRFYSLLNMIGLTSGLVCALFIFLWVREEVSMDRFHKNIEKLFVVKANYTSQSADIVTWSNTPGPLAEYIRESVPDVKFAARTFADRSKLFQYKETTLQENGLYADADLFEIFSYKILKGTLPKNGLDKTALMISQSMAKKLFADDEPLGKQVRVDNQTDMVVTAVFEDVPNESSIKFEFITPLQIYKESRGDGFNWGNFDHFLYLKLEVPKKIDNVTKLANQKFADFAKSENEPVNIEFIAQPFADAYLHNEFKNGNPAGGRIEYVRIFIVVAVFILLIACVNFMNMATARAVNRGKEIGVRKVVGAQRLSIVLQFMGESMLMSLAAMLLAIIFVYLTLPLFNIIVQKQIRFSLVDPTFFFSALCIVIVTGLMAGTYPALFLSSFKPVNVLKGVVLQRVGGISLRKALVVFQFSLTVVLIVSAIVVFQQVNYIRNVDPGYDRQSVMRFDLVGEIWNKFDAFRHEAQQVEGVVGISRSNERLVSINNQSSGLSWIGKAEDDQQLFQIVIVDYDFLETMKVNLSDGRSFSREINDTSNMVITKLAADRMGFDNPVGQKIKVWGHEGTIVGVADDILGSSVQTEIQPVVFVCKPEWSNEVFIRYEADKLEKVIAGLTGLFKKYAVDYPFNYKFMDDDFEALYKTENIAGSLALGFTIMAIIISSLGLLGLAAYTTERKRKEISVRKTMGATVSSLVASITKDFVRLSFVAALIGCPVAYYLMSQFLSGYAYHTNLEWGIFAITVLLTALISMGTVMFQVVKAAVANPVDALRNE